VGSLGWASTFAVPYSDHWYEVVADGTLRQGDIFQGLSAFLLAEDSVQPPVEIEEGLGQQPQIAFEVVHGDWIILDASCDVDHSAMRQPNCKQVLMASVHAATKQALKADNEKEFNQRLEVMRRQLMQGRFLLAACDGVDPHFPLSFVQYNARVLLPHSYLLQHCQQPRLRLLSPIRETFGNWVGSCFSRVGPEEDAQIPRFVQQLHAGQVIGAAEG